jgi:hypothetical protein
MEDFDVEGLLKIAQDTSDSLKHVHNEEEVDRITHSKFTKEKIDTIVKILKYRLNKPNFEKWDKKLYMTVMSWATDSIVPFKIQNLAMPLLLKYLAFNLNDKGTNKRIAKLIEETEYYDEHIS